MKRLIKNKKGFTLVELLVVISIIAVLSVVGLTLFSGAQVNARDARRKADVDAIAKALEIKRLPGVVYYQAIVNTDMSSGLIPEDSVNASAKYCIKVYTTDDGAKAEANPVVGNWASTSACPTTPTNFREATTAVGFNATNFAANTYKSFKVCARLEASGTAPYCAYSAQ